MINLLVDQSISLMNQYEKEGRTNDYWKMQEVVEQSKRYKENLEKILDLNFENPSEELNKFCKENNLSLNDPNVKKEFLKIRKEYLDKINNFYTENLFLNPGINESIKKTGKKKSGILKQKKDKVDLNEKSKKEVNSKSKNIINAKPLKKSNSKYRNILIFGSIAVLIISVIIILAYYYLPNIKFKF